MTPERWQQVERVYHGALDLDAAARSGFLDAECAGDPDLRREVESLLEGLGPGDRFLESAAPGIAARQIAADAQRPAPGRRLGSYVLVAPIGAGGMGEVWKALDPALGRHVAIKILPPQYSGDRDRLQRFEQEARAAGRLNHPNVLAVYAVGREGDSPYVVTELLEGATLRAHLVGGPPGESKAIEVAEQIVQGLAAAHEQGIVHRDLKPENVFITRDGRVKILDFGIAKLVRPGDGEDPTRTATGVLLGTPAYMSPEQVSGRSVDHRSDIFAAGSVLYEMLSGTRAFPGATSAEAMSAILTHEPPPIPAVSPVVDHIVRHCLEKNPERRFQSARDLAFQLRVALHPSTGVHAGAPPGSRARLLAVAAVVAAVAVAFVALNWQRAPAETSNPDPVLTRLTSDTGLSIDPALSPDGKLLAYASDRHGDGNLDIWLQQVGKGVPLRLTSDPADDREPSFSPDGTRIVFRSDRGDGGIYLVSTLGGPVTRLADQGRSPRFSPDGTSIAYWVGNRMDSSRSTGSRSYVVAASGGTPVQIASGFIATRFPRWSPGGSHILFIGSKEPVSLGDYDWWVAPVGGGEAIRTGAAAVLRRSNIGDSGPLSIAVPADWTDEGVIFAGMRGDVRNIWRLPIATATWQAAGTPRRLTHGAGLEDLPTAAAGRIAFVNVFENTDVWSLPLHPIKGVASGAPERLTDNAAMDIQPGVSADARLLVFASNRAGNFDVWKRDLRSGVESAISLSTDFESIPQISADGSKVAYNRLVGQKAELYVASTDERSTNRADRVCETDCFVPWGWLPGNRHLLYWPPTRTEIGVLDVISGEKSIVLKHHTYPLLRADLSADGRWIAFVGDVAVDRGNLFVAPFRGMTPIPEASWVVATTHGGIPHWSPDGNALYFVHPVDGYDCLWRQALEPATKHPVGEPTAVYHFHGARRSISNVGPSYREISIARDRMVFPMSERIGNIWMAEWAP